MSSIDSSMSLPTAMPYLPDSNASSVLAERLLAGAGMHGHAAHGQGASVAAGDHSQPNPQAIGKAFEEIFASVMVKHMRQTMGHELFGKDPGEVCGGLFDHFMSQHIAQHGSLGIGKMIEKNLNKRSSHHA